MSILFKVFSHSSIPLEAQGMSFCPSEKAKAQRGADIFQEPQGVSSRTDEDPSGPAPPLASPSSHTVSLGSCSLPGAHLNRAQLVCELARSAGKERSLGQGRNRRCVSLGLVVIKCRHCSLPPHHLLPLFRTSSPFLLPLFALEMAENPSLAANRT